MRAGEPHTPTKLREDWQLSLVAPDGNPVWTIPGSSLTGGKPAWFGHGVESGGMVQVVVVQPDRFWTDVHFVELDSATAAVKRNLLL